MKSSSVLFVGCGDLGIRAGILLLAENWQVFGVRRSLEKLPAGFTGAIRSGGSVLRAVVIAGRPHHADGGADGLERGSYFGSQGAADHVISSSSTEATVLYVRTDGPYDIVRDRD